MKKIMILIAMIFALGSLPAASYAGGTGGQGERFSMLGVHGSRKIGEASYEYRASTIIGRWVKNKEGDYLGRITDLMIDPQNGGMALAVLCPVARRGLFEAPFCLCGRDAI